MNLLPKEDRENKFNIVNNDEILRKKSKAGAKATGRKFNFPEKIKKHPKIIINEIIKYFYNETIIDYQRKQRYI